MSELTDKQIKEFMRKAHDIVKSNFSPKEHLPPAIYRFLKPIVDSTCQGWYATTMMVLGSMAPCMNGAAVRIWNQKPTPLVAAVFQIGDPQAGKSRLFAVCEEIFDTCDDVIAEYADEILRERLAEVPAVIVKSINLQSFTFPEFFYRNSSTFPQIEYPEDLPGAAPPPHPRDLYVLTLCLKLYL